MNMTPRNQLALLAVGQAQKEVTHNEALLTVDTLLHLSVKSRAIGAPPVDAVAGDCWIVGPDPTGAWAGQSDAIAVFEGNGWGFVSPRTGMMAWIEDERAMTVWNGAWSVGWPVNQFQPALMSIITLPSGGTTVDDELRQSFMSLVSALQTLGLIG